MLFENNKPRGDAIRPARAPARGPAARGEAEVSSTSNAVQEEKAPTGYSIVNFFRGTVTSDRLRHENAAQNGGLAHRHQNADKQKQYDDPLLNAGSISRTDLNAMVQQSAVSHASTSQSPGMGLESENLQSFITTGSHHKVIPISSPIAGTNGSALDEEAYFAPVTNLETVPAVLPMALPLVSEAAGSVFSYRRKRSLTFTNMLARSANQK